MDLLPAESSQMLPKKHRFRSLKLVNVNMEEALSQTPYGVDYGRLDNGLTYYVRSNSKPKMRAALALAVRAGYILLFSTTLPLLISFLLLFSVLRSIFLFMPPPHCSCFYLSLVFSRN